MGRDWKKWAEEKGIHKWFRRDNFIILVLSGILLVIIALPAKEDTGQKGSSTLLPSDRSFLQSESDRTEHDNSVSVEPDNGQAYASDMEKRLTDALSRIAGVGKVKVMITLKSSKELVVEKEQPVQRSSTNESDSQGGSRITSQMESEENTVYRTEGSLSEPYVVKTLPPQVEGVLVVAEGAGSGAINRTIVEIIQALFGVEAHKVQVVKME